MRTATTRPILSARFQVPIRCSYQWKACSNKPSTAMERWSMHGGVWNACGNRFGFPDEAATIVEVHPWNSAEFYNPAPYRHGVVLRRPVSDAIRRIANAIYRMVHEHCVVFRPIIRSALRV